LRRILHARQLFTEAEEEKLPPLPVSVPNPEDHLNPSASDYGRNLFTDKCEITVYAGSGGNGCVSFLREKYISAGPANGGDGGTGGNVYIQAVREEKSLHKIARRVVVKAERGKNGMGKSKGGQRGEDVVIEVPVGTVITELGRWDAVAEEERDHNEVSEEQNWARRDQENELRPKKNRRRQEEEEELDEEQAEEAPSSQPGKKGKRIIEGDQRGKWRRDKWLMTPDAMPSDYATADFPALPRPRRSNIASTQPPAPITLDLSAPTPIPVLIAAGAMGGLGNPHFATKSITRPKFATKGDQGMRLKLELELKLLADLGFVGLPNAGKSTLLRALSNSRARVGSWAFTTLTPNIGTVVLDDHKGRAKLDARDADGQRRTNFTIADIPGLVPDAHQDRGLGLDFLRHIERARVLAFVVDLGAGDAVESVRGLWRELDMYEKLREREQHERSQVNWTSVGSTAPAAAHDDRAVAADVDQPVIWRSTGEGALIRPEIRLQPISEKPWFVVATKADLDGSQANFASLTAWVRGVETGEEAHPAGETRKHRWTGSLAAVPVSAINGHGVEQIVRWTAEVLAK